MQSIEYSESISSIPSIVSYTQTIYSCAKEFDDDYIDTQAEGSEEEFENTINISLYSTRKSATHLENTQQPSCHCELF
ncbi:unnamed protein product [Blepharisma stoltei]|uniref:Uncharacterized protein n=1 Tax=Blepharisma stoltei TaxID=1481888 RepID=A0AAU9IWC9_9CILI|nr:unnamed protein product [Blepharisma stoltei]